MSNRIIIFIIYYERNIRILIVIQNRSILYIHQIQTNQQCPYYGKVS